MKRILRTTITIVAGILLAYAVLFSLAGTVVLWWTAKTVLRPVREVRRLADHNPKESAWMAAQRRQLAREGENDSLAHDFVPLDSISLNLRNAVVASEDDGFFVHPGFDLNAILSAYEYNKVKGRIARGGSTISQQVAKNLFLSDSRTYARKFQELFYTILLEGFLTKERILELYLNYAQWGDRIFGCEAAAKHYFGSSSRYLSVWEATRLAAVLAKPETMSPHYTKSSFLWKRLRVIADNMYRRGKLGDSLYTVLTGSPPPRPDSVDVSEGEADVTDEEVEEDEAEHSDEP